MIRGAIRCLAVLTFLFAVWVAGGWLLDPQLPALPSPVEKAWIFEHFMPLFGVAIALYVKGMLPASVLWTASALVMVTLLAASGLAAWLSWRNVDREALRRLNLALSLCVLSAAWFCRLRGLIYDEHRDLALMLDYPFMLAGFIGGWMLLACFSIYPEPISRALMSRSVERRAGVWQRLAMRQRAGEGVWRLWSWLPPERYGLHGRADSPELRGIARFLRSRELLWCLAFPILLTVIWRYSPNLLRSADPIARGGASIVVAFLAMYLVDPLFGSRMEVAGATDSGDARWRGVRFSAALHDAMIGRSGFALGATFAIIATWCWHRGGSAMLPAVLFVVVACMVVLGLVVNTLYVNWIGGNSAHRRAISWIFLGTAIPTLLWIFAAAVLVFIGLGRLGDEPPANGQLPWALAWQGALILMGVPASMLAFVLSLWVSILHRGSFDPTLALRRGAGVVALGVVLTALFVAVEGAASSLIVTQLGMPSASGPIVAGTAVAIGFQPLRARVERGVQSAMLKLLPPEAVAEGERREQAVLFADLSGYSRLAESDETEALTLAAILHRHAHVVAAEQGGRVVKTIGDAVLCLFDDPAQAMAAAIALQQGYRDEAARRDLEPLPVHAGLHAGEVVIARGGDVFGANVNLAARLLNLAGADELVATQSVATAAVAAGLVVESLPARRFKNIAEPVDCLRIRLDLA